MKKLFIILLWGICFCFNLVAQPSMTLYQMHDIPQSNTLNPAVPIQCGWIVGLPGLGGVSAGLSMPLSYNDFGAGTDTLNVNNILSSLHNKNMVTTSASANILTVGYRANRTFYQFTINERFNQVSSISRDPIDLLLRGNGGYVGQTVKASPSINATYYREYAFNIAQEINSTFWIGARAKLLFGRMSMYSVNNSAEFYTHPNTYNLSLTSDVLVRTSVPGSVSINNQNGKVSDFDTNIKAGDFIFNPSNIGAGVDLGLTKEFESGMKISASILNLGFINWNKNLHTFRQKGTLNFNGPFSYINELDALVDTVKTFLKLDYENQASYTQMLAPMVMTGINYPVNDFLRVGITGMVEFQPNVLPWVITATGFTKNLPFVDFGLSYTVTPYSFFNIGLGVGAHLGSVDIHVMTDNIIGALRPFDARYATFQFGLSFRLGQSECDVQDSGVRGNRPSYRALPCPIINSPRR